MTRSFVRMMMVAAAGLFMSTSVLWLYSCGSVTADSDTKPSAVSGIIASAGDGRNTIQWNVVTNAASYNLYWDTEPGVSPSRHNLRAGNKIAGLTSTVYTHTGLTNGIIYYYVVTAVSPGGKESDPPSGDVSARPEAAVTCSSSETLCGSVCADLQTDRNHCGACGNNCPSAEVCKSGTCEWPASEFVGNWGNVDSATNSITKVYIQVDATNVTIHPWGKCSPTDCDWGAKSYPISSAYSGGKLHVIWVNNYERDMTFSILPNGNMQLYRFNVGAPGTTWTDVFAK